MCVWEIGGFLGEGDLDTSRAPRDECCKTSLADSKKRFMNLHTLSVVFINVRHVIENDILQKDLLLLE